MGRSSVKRIDKKERRTTVKQLLSGIQIFAYTNYRELLRDLYERCKKNLSPYSYQDFSEDLGYARSNIFLLIISGKRSLSSQGLLKMIYAMDLSGVRRRYLTALVNYNNAKGKESRDRLFERLVSIRDRNLASHDLSTLKSFYSRWYHPIIREMVHSSGFDGTAEWIKKHLQFPLRIEQVRESLDVLAALNVIKFDEKSEKYIRTPDQVQTEPEVDHIAFIQYHQEILNISREALTTIEGKQRDFRATTVILPESAMAEVKVIVRNCMLEILELEKRYKSANQVCQVNFQVFPVSKA